MNPQVSENKINHILPITASGTSSGDVVGEVENLSIIAKLVKCKKSDLAKAKTFVKVSSFKQIFILSKLKKHLYIYKKLLPKH